MRHHYKKLNLSKLILFITANLLLVSCGAYQNVSNDDGIYDDETKTEENKKVIVVNEKEYKEYEENYFLKELKRLQSINDSDIFTDVETFEYDSEDEYSDEDYDYETPDYNSNQPWGYEDNDIVVNINYNRNPYWGHNNWAFYDSWG